MTVITRFAPSPTGFLHIGGARTALFNFLYARHIGGKFLLRIEDTDRDRSTDTAKSAIIAGLNWLGLDYDGEIIYQSKNVSRHKEIAEKLLAEGKAYRCYTTPEELQFLREQGLKYDRKWRDFSGKTPDRPFAVRLKAPLEGFVTIKDKVQGEVSISSKELDDIILLRSDETPTYMLAVVVDDYDMGVTHIIRGDDHLTNAFRQKTIYDALDWQMPKIAHIPLIHGTDGAKLSKRHGALAIDEYQKMGYLPEAICNYLLRLGWSHGNDEIISQEKAIEWFDFKGLGKAPSRLDFVKLNNVNSHYIKNMNNLDLAILVAKFMDNPDLAMLTKAMEGLKSRAKTLFDLAIGAEFYFAKNPIPLDKKSVEIINNCDFLNDIIAAFKDSSWDIDSLKLTAKNLSEEKGLKLGDIMQPIRASITGSTKSPSMFEVMEILGRQESLARLEDATK